MFTSHNDSTTSARLDLAQTRPGCFRRRCCRAAAWAGSTAMIALLPKCVACVIAYLAVGTSAGLAGREICGAVDDTGFAGGIVSQLASTPVAINLLLVQIIAGVAWLAWRSVKRVYRA